MESVKLKKNSDSFFIEQSYDIKTIFEKIDNLLGKGDLKAALIACNDALTQITVDRAKPEDTKRNHLSAVHDKIKIIKIMPLLHETNLKNNFA